MRLEHPLHSLEKFEATPLVVDGVMYTVQAPNDVVALDAETGRQFWVYSYTPSNKARPCCGRVNRGLAISLAVPVTFSSGSGATTTTFGIGVGLSGFLR